MRHRGTKTIETPRLVLRRFRPQDLQSFYRHCLSDYHVWCWTNYPKASAAEEVTARTGLFTKNWYAAYEHPNRYSWAIAEKPDGPAIGRISGVRLDERAQDIELTYELGREFWGRGYMTEAVRAVLRFFFEEVGLYRVHAYHASENPASGRVMRKCGMRPEGVWHMACVCNGGRFDQVNFGILRDEFMRGREK